jgi:hypothetical protein
MDKQTKIKLSNLSQLSLNEYIEVNAPDSDSEICISSHYGPHVISAFLSLEEAELLAHFIIEQIKNQKANVNKTIT